MSDGTKFGLKPNASVCPNPTMMVSKNFFKDFLDGKWQSMIGTELKSFFDTLDDRVE